MKQTDLKMTTPPSSSSAVCDNVKDIDFDKHVDYILSLEQETKTSDALYFTDHKRLSGVYWAISSLSLMNKFNEDRLPSSRIIAYVLSCYDSTTGLFSGNTDQDTHLLYTLSGIQILAMYNQLDKINVDLTTKSICDLQQDDGSFKGDQWGETDSRFTYCSVLSLSIMNRVEDLKNADKAVEYIKKCQNFDGGFGCIPNSESHAGQVFCCVGTLCLLNKLDIINKERLGFWLCERQLSCGGFNGRPDKLEDVCYSWWVLSSLSMLNMIDFIDSGKLTLFITNCQDMECGGFADRPGDMPDVFHTFFGLAALSLLGDQRLDDIDPAFALPRHVVDRILMNKKKTCAT